MITRLRFLWLVCLATTLLFASCAEKDEEGDVVMPPQQISLNLFADDDLNSYNGTPASLTVCVYQLASRRDFDKLAEDGESFRLLLGGEDFADSVLARQRAFVDPGEKRTLTLERRPNARYLGIAAGYHAFRPAQTSIIVPLPTTRRRMGRRPRGPVINLSLTRDAIATRTR